MPEMSYKNENKHTKYNHVAPIDLDTIPPSEKEQALKEFAEGSPGLEICLRAMWSNELKTHACCNGEDAEYDTGYIAMAEGVDVFSYLSEELLSSDMIALELETNRQIIRLGGPAELKEKMFASIAKDIFEGKKENNSILQNKIGQPLNQEWLTAGRIDSMRKAGLPDEEIEKEERRRELFGILDNGSQADSDAIMPELLELIGELNQKLVNKSTPPKAK